MIKFLAVVIPCVSLLLSPPETRAFTNPGFEGQGTKQPANASGSGATVTGMLGEGWRDGSSGKVVVEYAIDRTDPRTGSAAQSVKVSKVPDGANAQLEQPVKLAAGVGVRFSVWLRGRTGQSVRLALRQTEAPWRTYFADAALSPEWREYSVQAVPEKDSTGVVAIMAFGAASFQVDDASYETLGELSANRPAKIGNLITGGSFETVRPPFGWATRRQGDADWDWADLPQRTDQVGVVGSRSLRVDFHANTGFSEIRSPVFAPNGDRRHSASVWMKASVGNQLVRMGFDNTKIVEKFTVGTEWKRYTITDTMPFVEWSRLRVSVFAPKGPWTLWIDGAMVEERDQPSESYLSASPVDLTLNLDRPGHILHDGESAEAKIEIAPQPPAGSVLELSVEDLLGESQPLPSMALPVEKVTMPELPGRPRGMFKLRAVVRDPDGKIISSPTELIWARLPKPRELDPTRSYFGLHLPISPDYLAMARAAGMRWVRLHDTSSIGKWPIAEPEPGKWKFYDTQIDAVHAAGLAILGMLDGAPARVATKQRSGYFAMYHIPDRPEAVDQWRNYVRTVVGHYRGRIDHWEVWNEPWGQWWTGAGGTPELYATLLQTAYVEAKAVNPAATIVGINTMRSMPWTEKVLSLTGTESFDAFSFHDYGNVLYGGNPSAARKQVDAFAAFMAKVGTPKPQWNTEGGLSQAGSWYTPLTRGMAPRVQVSFAVRFDVCMLAAGVKAFMMYGVHTNSAMGQVEFRCDEFDRAIKPVIAARSVLASLVDGIGPPVYDESQSGIDRYVFPVDGGQVVSVLWAVDGQTHQVQIGADTEVLDALGSPKRLERNVLLVDSEPVYVITRLRR